jgi:hypothetical protein
MEEPHDQHLQEYSDLNAYHTHHYDSDVADEGPRDMIGTLRLDSYLMMMMMMMFRIHLQPNLEKAYSIGEIRTSNL